MSGEAIIGRLENHFSGASRCRLTSTIILLGESIRSRRHRCAYSRHKSRIGKVTAPLDLADYIPPASNVDPGHLVVRFMYEEVGARF